MDTNKVLAIISDEKNTSVTDNDHFAVARTADVACRHIDWEMRRYETARAILAGLAASDRPVVTNDVGYAIYLADTLIEQLKEERVDV